MRGKDGQQIVKERGVRDSEFFIVGLVREQGSLIVFELGICLIFIRNRIGDTATGSYS